MAVKEQYRYKARSGPSPETVRKRATQSSGSYDNFVRNDFQRYQPGDGENTIRILPRTWDDTDQWEDSWGITIYTHSYIGPDNSNFLCKKKTFKKSDHECPVCDVYEQLKSAADAAGDDNAKTEANKFKASKKCLVWLIDRDAEKNGPMWWIMPITGEKDLSTRTSKIGENIAIADPDEGYDVSFSKEGKLLNTKYLAWDIDREKSYLSENQKRQDKWLDYIEQNNLPSILELHDDDYMAKAVRGVSTRKDDDDEEDKPRSRRNGRDEEDDKSTRRSRARDDEDEEEERSTRRSRGRDEDEEKPARRRERARDDEDEEEERQTRRGRDRDEEEDEERVGRPNRNKARDEDEDEAEDTSRNANRRGNRVRSEGSDEEETNRPKRRTSSERDEQGGKRNRSRDEDEEDGEEEDEEKSSRPSRRPNRDEEDERPRRSAKAGKDKDVEEEEDEEEDAKASVERLRNKHKR